MWRRRRCDQVFCLRIKVKADRHGLPMSLLWSRRIIAFKLYFSSHKRVLQDFPFLVSDLINPFLCVIFYYRCFKNKMLQKFWNITAFCKSNNATKREGSQKESQTGLCRGSTLPQTIGSYTYRKAKRSRTFIVICHTVPQAVKTVYTSHQCVCPHNCRFVNDSINPFPVCVCVCGFFYYRCFENKILQKYRNMTAFRNSDNPITREGTQKASQNGLCQASTLPLNNRLLHIQKSQKVTNVYCILSHHTIVKKLKTLESDVQSDLAENSFHKPPIIFYKKEKSFQDKQVRAKLSFKGDNDNTTRPQQPQRELCRSVFTFFLIDFE